MDINKVIEAVDVLNVVIDDSVKFQTLKHQYGVASRRISELKGANALLRETNAALVAELNDLEARLAQLEAPTQTFTPATTTTAASVWVAPPNTPLESPDWKLVSGEGVPDYSWTGPNEVAVNENSSAPQTDTNPQ